MNTFSTNVANYKAWLISRANSKKFRLIASIAFWLIPAIVVGGIWVASMDAQQRSKEALRREVTQIQVKDLLIHFVGEVPMSSNDVVVLKGEVAAVIDSRANADMKKEFESRLPSPLAQHLLDTFSAGERAAREGNWVGGKKDVAVWLTTLSSTMRMRDFDSKMEADAANARQILFFWIPMLIVCVLTGICAGLGMHAEPRYDAATST
jgi:hypothetical protein